MRRAAASLLPMARARGALTSAPVWGDQVGDVPCSLRALAARCCIHTTAPPARDAPRTSEVDGSDEVLGVMTPVTRRLWLARLARQATATAARRTPGSAPPPIVLRAGPVPAEPTTVEYPLSSSPAMRAMYRNPWGAVRLGRVLEDLDSLAGSIALSHCDAGEAGSRPPMLVTAAVDAIRLHRPLPSGADLAAVGAVVWTGKTSMDIRIEVHDGDGDGQQQAAAGPEGGGLGISGSLLGARPPALAATFTFACRDPDTAAPLAIPPLATPTHPVAQAWWEERAGVAAARRAARASSAASAQDPTSSSPAAAAWVDSLVDQARTVAALPALAPPGVLLSSATALSNSFICQPQQRNLAGRIFGGLIMRRAFEIGYACAYTFAGWRPTLTAVDEVAFLAPVDVGDLLSLRAAVLHSSTSPGGRRGHIHVVVTAHVIRPEGRSSALSNTFHFKYACDLAPHQHQHQQPGGEKAASVGPPSSLRTVLPSSPEEARMVAAHYPARRREREDLRARVEG